MRLEELKISLQSQFGREATIAEWADSAGLNCRALKAQLRRGNRSKEKLVQANLRMVHHIAKTYQGRGISHEDLLQVVLGISIFKSILCFLQSKHRFYLAYTHILLGLSPGESI